ncbi:craniofacial development protein 2 [Ictalurus punctatus]|uniref:Craniofacial development protein 2 n=1 Tax=Ictalurus punctatus TaxID=7998 RepID=A0A9F7RIS9_ICTPU|nr:craniofacial development protein 2 [Ictalurus punctatus]XP_053537269.1 craniofacial development protein 2 [Ictalurus punctatus]
MTNPEKVKAKFYEDLHSVISDVPRTDKITILGNFNARVSIDSSAWDGVLAKHRVDHCNSNGLLLLQTCAEHELLITNTVFRLPTRNRTSWMHPRSKHWHIIDYVIVRKRDRQDVRVTKSMCGAEFWTDHRLIMTKLNIRIQPNRRPQGKKAPKRLNITKLKYGKSKQSFKDALGDRLESTSLDSQNVEADWAALRELVYDTATEILGLSTRKIGLMRTAKTLSSC